MYWGLHRVTAGILWFFCRAAWDCIMCSPDALDMYIFLRKHAYQLECLLSLGHSFPSTSG